MTTTQYSYETLKTLAKETECKVSDLIALAPQNDPFYQGTPGQVQLAEWFADIYHGQQWGRTKVHLRRCHYAMLSLGVTMPNGKPYENTEACWDTLGIASKAARYLNLVDVAAFDDKRNDEPVSYALQYECEAGIRTYGYLYQSDVQVPDFPDPPGYIVSDYHAEQRYHLEIWCEKSTMNDVLLPLCQSYHAVLQTGAGELSITATRLLIERLQRQEKPARLFYISDFDPAGQSMPVAISRKLEFFVRSVGIGLDIRLFPIVMTAAQVRRYQLPRTPIKESEKRRDHFESQYGTGAVELDALEALYPGELRRLVSGYLSEYYDADLERQANRRRETLENDLRAIRRDVLARYEEELEAVKAELEQLRQDFGPRMEAYGYHLKRLWQAMNEELDARALNIADYPPPGAAHAREVGEGLYNSQRDYLEQIDAYKKFQGKP